MDPGARSRLMARIRGKDTAVEVVLRKALWGAGYRYRLHPQLPGKPDIAFVGSKVAIFVDGCFWHSCPVHGHLPKTNQNYWAPKLAKNQERDQKSNEALMAMGWMPLRVWEHEIKADVAKCVTRISDAIELRG